MEENNEKKEKRAEIKKEEKRVIIIIIIIAIINAILIIKAIFIPIIEIKQTIDSYCGTGSKEKYKDEYKQQVEEYLSDKYNKQFEATLFKEGTKLNVDSIDGSRFACGYDGNVKEYIFKVVSKEDGIISYITLWKYENTKETKIMEIDGEKIKREDTSYERYSKLYNVKNIIQNIIPDTYTIEVNNEKKVVSINTKEDFEEQYFTDSDKYKELFKEIKEKTEENVIVEVEFEKSIFGIEKNTNIEDIFYRYDYIKEIKNIAEKYIKNEYNVNKYISVIKIEDEFEKNKYSKMFNALIQLSKEYKNTICDTALISDDEIKIQNQYSIYEQLKRVYNSNEIKVVFNDEKTVIIRNGQIIYPIIEE